MFQEDETAQTDETFTTTETVIEKELSEDCDMLLCTGYNNGDYYELVANQFDAYPSSTFEFGVIKNNKWLVKMSSKCPFIEENGWWKGARFENTPGEFKHLGNGYFYYSHNDWNNNEIVYNPENGVNFHVYGLAVYSAYKNYLQSSYGTPDYTKLINENGELLAELCDGNYTFSYLNMNTGEIKEIPLKLTNKNNDLQIGLLGDGLFYAYSSGFTGTDYMGFFDLTGKQIIDLTEYNVVDLGNRIFENREYTITCKNDSGVEFYITFDTTGKIIRQEKK